MLLRGRLEQGVFVGVGDLNFLLAAWLAGFGSDLCSACAAPLHRNGTLFAFEALGEVVAA